MGPGIAVAERIRSLDDSVEIAFLCSERAVDRKLLGPDGWDFTPMPAKVPSKHPLKLVGFAIGWRRTTRLAARLIGSKPDVRVVSLGGFVAPPVVAAANAVGVPVDLLNLDVVPGRANRWVSRRAVRVFTTVGTDLPGAGAPLGMPLRRAVQPVDSKSQACVELGLDPNLRTLLVTGASQGARSIDRFMGVFVARCREALDGWQVLHLANGAAVPALMASYAEAGIPHVVLPFLDRMGLAWTVADLAISRGGASSVAEIAFSRTPAIILPYPWHRDRHQAENAATLAASGLAEILDDPIDGPRATAALQAHLSGIMQDPDALARRRDMVEPPTTDPAEVLATRILDP